MLTTYLLAGRVGTECVPEEKQEREELMASRFRAWVPGGVVAVKPVIKREAESKGQVRWS